MDPVTAFNEEKRRHIEQLGADPRFRELALRFMREVAPFRYSYNFTWLGRPIIQYPQDIVSMQEIIWEVRPDLIIETGIGHGGSLVFYASMLELLGGDRLALGIDIEIRPHNRAAIEAHPMFKRIEMIEASSTDPETVRRVAQIVEGRERVLVCLDSNHTHDHVFAELRLYAPFVTVGSYLVVFDTIVEEMPETWVDRPWGKGNNPLSAVEAFLRETDAFVVDRTYEWKSLITGSPGGFLKRVR